MMGYVVAVVALIAFTFGVVWMVNAEHKSLRASPPYQCAKVYGTDTKEYAMCVYELPRGLREKP